jgi:hypothetical protein
MSDEDYDDRTAQVGVYHSWTTCSSH